MTWYWSHFLGFYCPDLSTCMVPCPLGAYCIQSREHYVNSPIRQGTIQSICKSLGFCCINWQGKHEEPVQVTLKNGTKIFTCPGMPQPHPCPKGSYCPDTTTKTICKSGHYCPQGSIEPLKCPVRSFCCSTFCFSWSIILLVKDWNALPNNIDCAFPLLWLILIYNMFIAIKFDDSICSVMTLPTVES